MTKKTFYIFLFVISMFFTACEIVTYEDIKIKPYDGSLKWERVTKNAEWSNRYDHAAIAFDNKLWVMGGYNSGGLKGDAYLEDVWSSADGENWELILANAPWKGRRGHKLVVFDDGSGEAIYLLGGFSMDEETGYRQYNNDVWKSTNGQDWVQIKERSYPSLDSESDWFPRMSHACVVANHQGIDYIYIIGGKSMLENHSGAYSMDYFNDVWRSQDGIEWTKLGNNNYGVRAEHAAAVNPSNGRIYIQGGVFGTKFEAENNGTRPLDNWSWIWSSDDGELWIPENDTTTFDQSLLDRSAHQMVFFNNTIWGLPGKTISNVHYGFVKPQYYSSWTFDESGQLMVDSNGSDIDARHGYTSVVFNNKIWVLGGFTNKNGQANDVWSAK